MIMKATDFSTLVPDRDKIEDDVVYFDSLHKSDFDLGNPVVCSDLGIRKLCWCKSLSAARGLPSE